MKKSLKICIGVIATGLAAIGVWTPGLPTTVFLIIALWAFAGSSTRLHNWLTHAPIFKSAMVHALQFETRKTVKKEVKVVAQVFAWGSFVWILILNGFYSFATGIVFFAATLCSLAMYKLKTG